MADKNELNKEPTLADVLAAIGSMGQRVDSIGTRLDAVEEKKDAFPADLKKDAEEKERKDAEEKAKADAEEEEKKKADAEEEAKKKADAEEEEKKKADAACAEKVAADAKKDADALRADNDALKKRLATVEARLPQDRSDDDHRSMSASQARADSVYELFGKKAPRFLSGESNGEYRRRLIREFTEHSPTWKAVDVGALADSAFEVAEGQIYNDAAAAAKNAIGVEDGGLRMVAGTTPSGHKKVEFFGRPGAWMGRFSGSRRYATHISPNTKREVS